MTRHLLAATDLSAASNLAAERAARLAAEHGWSLCLEHVLNLGALEHLRLLIAQGAGSLPERLRAEARDELDQLATRLNEAHGPHIGARLAEGAVVDELLHQADALDACLLVLGAQGERPFRHGLLGSTTERMLHASARPLLVVKATPREAYRRVLVPVDFSGRSLPALCQAHALAPQAELVLLHAYEIPFEGKLRRAGMNETELSGLLLDLQHQAAHQMDALIAESGLEKKRLTRSLLHGEPARRILEQQQARDCDLIVLGKRGLGRLQSWLLGSVGNHVLGQAECDLLLVNAPED